MAGRDPALRVDPTAKIGFHAAYISKEGQLVETGAGNALVGAYLNQLGLSSITIFYVTSADPRSMRWLSLADAATFGIEVEALPTGNAPPPTASPATPERSLEARTAGYVTSIMATYSNWSANWSGSNEQAVKTLQQAYGAQVSYYGKLLSRQDVLADKRKFIERWPQRKYEIRTPTLATSCKSRICTVTGVVDWMASNPATSAHAKGTAQFEYQVIWADEGPAIFHEAGKVLNREGPPPVAPSKSR